jgi:hypothetical protein
MPRILVTTEPIDKPDDGVMLDERVATSDLASNHFAAQLIERIGWALTDAENTEHRPIDGQATRTNTLERLKPTVDPRSGAQTARSTPMLRLG